MNVTITRETHPNMTCECCGQVTTNLTPVVDSYGYTVEWCDECVEGTEVCDHCGCNCEETHTVVSSWRYWRRPVYADWCTSCWEEETRCCEHCEEAFAEDLCEEYELWDGTHVWLCERCRGRDYTKCDYCGRYVLDGDLEYTNGHNCCPDCYEEHYVSDVIESYGHTDGSYFWFDDASMRRWYDLTYEDKRVLFVGIELEVDNLSDRNALVDNLYCECGSNLLNFKEDGTLDRDCGVEIVSQPMTPLFHLNAGLWEKVTSEVRYYDGTSHDAGNCGLHMHVNRSFFDDCDASYRMDRLFHRFREQLIRFSRRVDLEYCELDEDDLANVKDVHEKKRIWYEKKEGERYDHCARYVAVNTTNSDTVEIRLWRGTLNMETFRATIELTAGLAIICNTMSDELAEGLTWNMLKLLVRYSLEAANIPHDDLDSYLVRRGL